MGATKSAIERYREDGIILRLAVAPLSHTAKLIAAAVLIFPASSHERLVDRSARVLEVDPAEIEAAIPELLTAGVIVQRDPEGLAAGYKICSPQDWKVQ